LLFESSLRRIHDSGIALAATPTHQSFRRALKAGSGPPVVVLWERRGASARNVTFPARQYSVNGEKRTFTLLRPIADTAAQERIRELVLQAYAECEDRAARG